MAIAAWLVLRIVYALFFLYPLKDLLKDWSATKNLVGLLIPFYQGFFSMIMVLVMIVGALSVAFGIYTQIAGILLLGYCLFGVIVHYRLAALAKQQVMSSSASSQDRTVLENTKNLAVVGNLTSGQKNVVLAAMAFFFIVIGSGPCSVTSILW